MHVPCLLIYLHTCLPVYVHNEKIPAYSNTGDDHRLFVRCACSHAHTHRGHCRDHIHNRASYRTRDGFTVVSRANADQRRRRV